MGRLVTDPTFTLRLESGTGQVTTVPISFDVERLTPDQQLEAVARWDRKTPSQLAASILFSLTGLPPDDWPIVGPVIQGVIEGDMTHMDVANG
jgi:hypothetical protein